jgi:hypothetical protein
MNRRQSLLAISALAGHALFPEVLERFARATAAPSAHPDDWRPSMVPPEARPLLAEIVETILPTTDTPGAKAARVHVFVDLVLAHCVPADGQATALAALRGLAAAGFVGASPDARQRQLAHLDPAPLALFKELTVLGYFTSEIGATLALRYDAVPGGYHGCVELLPGQKAWAT